MLSNLVVFGSGRWPSEWKLYPDDRSVLASLHRKGLVTEAHYLTDEGAAVAMNLLSPEARQLAARVTARRRAGLV